MAVALDLLTTIIDIRLGLFKPVFVAGGPNEIVLYGTINKDNELEFIDIGPLDFVGERSYGGVSSSSFRMIVVGDSKVPTFVLGGSDQHVDDSGTDRTAGIIMTSSDGLNWTKTATIENTDYEGNEAEVRAIVWDDNAFYADVGSDEYYFRNTETQTGLEVRRYDKLWSSTNGTGWAEAGSLLRYDSNGNPPIDNFYPPLFKPHVDSNVAKLPDGTFGYAETRDENNIIVESFLAVPSVPVHFWPGPPSELARPTIDVTTFKEGQETKTTKDVPIIVNCVAYLGGMLLAGGKTEGNRAAIALSTDKGATWKIVWTATQEWMREIWVISGGEI